VAPSWATVLGKSCEASELIYVHNQFFEAHGTGTQAGDPKEAAAIHECFGQYVAGSGTPLYVGSVKTVIGHLEGCAGLAGVLKGSAMIQGGFLAPNLHFNRLNPRIEPFYQGLHVQTQLSLWPKLPEGVPRRVSVNSFGKCRLYKISCRFGPFDGIRSHGC